MFSVYYISPIGLINIRASETSIIEIRFVEKEEESVRNAVLEAAVMQLDEYFSGQRVDFTLPVKQVGTAFQQSVWNELMNIPYGEVITYGDIAKKIGNEKAVRAVGAANGKNKIPIIVPCHRVIGHDGKAVGFAFGLERKLYLLGHEKKKTTLTAQLSLYG